MKRKLSFLLVLLFLSAWLPACTPVRAASPPELGMGYDAASIVPVSQAVPVYATGDQLWVESYYNQTITVELVPPGYSNTSNIMVQMGLVPYSPTLVHTWGASDAPGRWNLIAAISPRSFVVQTFTLGSVPVIPSPELKGYGLGSDGNLTLDYSMDLQTAYLGEGCVVGTSTPTTGTVPFPLPVGPGSMDVNLTMGNAVLRSSPTGITPSVSYFDFWLELYYPYSYASPNNQAQLTTSDVLVAKTAPVTFRASVGANASTPFTTLAHLREGRYELRAFFRDAQGIQLESDTVLLGGGGWTWFSNCEREISLASSFSFAQPLSAPTGRWPSGILYAAFSDGIEGVGFSPVSLNLTRISLRVEPYGGSVPDSLAVSAKGPAVSNDTYYDGSLYLSLARLPTQVVVSVGYPGAPPEEFAVVIASDRNSTSLGIPFGEVSVAATSNGVGFPNGIIAVNSTLGDRPNVATGVTSDAGIVNFSLLGGNYTLTLRAGGFTETETLRVIPGKSATLTFTIPYSPDLTLSYALLGTVAFGVVLNALVWRRVARSSD